MEDDKYLGRYCMNCKHKIKNGGSLGMIHVMCEHDLVAPVTKYYSPIYGELSRGGSQLCSIARADGGTCGIEGKYYEAKNGI